MSYWQDRNVLVTGASGFIGGHIAERLANEGASVVVLIRDFVPDSYLQSSHAFKCMTVVRGDIENLDTLCRVMNEYETERVFHLASQSQVLAANESPLSTFKANIEGTWNVLEACRRNSKLGKVVVASSDKAYGDTEQLPYTEDMALRGRYPYDVSKSCTDLVAQSFYYTYGLPVNIIRSGNVYGPGDLNWARLIPGTIRRIVRDVAPVVRGGGKTRRDYVYVDDVVDAYLKVASTPEKGQAFNIGTCVGTSVIEIVEMLIEQTGSTVLPYVEQEAPGELKDQFLDDAKARSQIGWRPQVDLEEGLEKTVAWYLEYLKAAKPCVSSA